MKAQQGSSRFLDSSRQTPRRRQRLFGITLAAIPLLACAFASPEVGAYSSGITTASFANQALGCANAGCHTAAVAAPTLTPNSFPTQVTKAALYCSSSLTVGTAVGRDYAGFNISTNSGDLSIGGSFSAGTQELTSQITHTAAKYNGAADVNFSWCFEGTSVGNVTWTIWGNNVNGDGVSSVGDRASSMTHVVRVCQDDDGDGFWGGANWNLCTPVRNPNQQDCSDNNGAISPGDPEICNNIDDDCDGTIDDGCDDDNDNFCDSGVLKAVGVLVSTCTSTASGASIGNDCNDAAPAVNPSATESCNNVNDNCDASTDEGCDDDGDDYCDSLLGYTGSTACPFGGADCNDSNVNVNPGRLEACNNLDDNCVGGVDDGCDDDNDNYCDAGLVYTSSSTCTSGGSDCDDNNLNINPSRVEVCNNLNDDCFGGLDDGCDDDNDNYCDSLMSKAVGVIVATCSATASGAAVGNDCDDTNSAASPGLSETCDNRDNDCNGSADEGCDDDNDAYCDSAMTKQASLTVSTCASTAFAATIGDDCNDLSSAVRPGAAEICNNVNDNCNGATDEGCDDDNDGYCDASIAKAPGVSVTTCTSTASGSSVGDDCNDALVAVSPAGTETCNNINDNCNGATDEGCDNDNDTYCDALMSKAAGVVVAVCSSTAQAAAVGNDCDDARANMNPGALEICDGLDNDCDGNDDDNIANSTCGLGTCERVASGCLNGVPQACTPGTPGTESCGNTGLDNDCDGNTLELEQNVYQGDSCSVPGAFGICAPGTRACSGSTLTCAAISAPAPESCANSGVDNDCDGDAFELTNGVHVGDVCSTGGSGICATGKRACSGTTLVCTPDFIPGQVAETCNNVGVDNDCDGNSAELADGVAPGSACTTGFPGVCSAGTRSCSSGSLTCVETIAVGSRVEICDNLDNNCDGTRDNNLPNLTCGTGVCANSVPACAGGSNNSCTPLPSSTEICDNKDNNCNGSLDEGCDDDNDGYCDSGMTFSGAASTCPSGPGDCDDVASFSNPGASEICDSEDNDCNGMEDDSVSELSCGIGECTRAASGCVNGEPENCTPGPVAVEVCDSKDNDCDGVVDNGLALAKCGVGLCATTGSSCLPASCTPLAAALEICDGKDNDCDGKSDEVDDVPLAECGLGECLRTGTTCAAESCVPGEALEEICDGFDNDCDGVVDDDLPLSTCGTGECFNLGGSCQPSTCLPLDPAAEECDGLDNDCDGEIDNGCDDDNDGYCDSELVYLSSPRCQLGGNDCDDYLADSYPGASEICDGLDNNCNGSLDDDLEPSNILCGTGACITTAEECLEGEPVNCEPHPPSDEICDGKDNDCNGIIDDDLDEIVCGVGECAVVVSGCTESATGECTPLEPVDEVCDGKDNDCDGNVDNDALCENGVCIVGSCIVLDEGQGGASGLIDYSPWPDEGLWVENLAGAAPWGGSTGLGPKPPTYQTPPDQEGSCSFHPNRVSGHFPWPWLLLGTSSILIGCRRRRAGIQPPPRSS